MNGGKKWKGSPERTPVPLNKKQLRKEKRLAAAANAGDRSGGDGEELGGTEEVGLLTFRFFFAFHFCFC